MDNNQICYETYDKVKLYDGDNFYFLNSIKYNDKVVYTIKFWDCKVMESFKKNNFYLRYKVLFSNKIVLKEFIIENKLAVDNFDHIFID